MKTHLQARNPVAFLMFSLLLSACAASTFEVKSDPPQAEVYFVNEKAEKKSLGKTPLKMTETELKAAMGEGITAGEFFVVGVEKEGFVSQTFNIPAAAYGAALTTLDVKMKPGTNAVEIRQAKEVIDHLFLAQKLATTQQFERAQIEIDKVLATFPTFARALSMRASIYFAQKNYPESMKWYEETLKADPEMESAVQMLAKVRTAQGLPPGPATPDSSARAPSSVNAPAAPAAGQKQ